LIDATASFHSILVVLFFGSSLNRPPFRLKIRITPSALQ
jgi:hypothetical protein